MPTTVPRDTVPRDHERCWQHSRDRGADATVRLRTLPSAQGGSAWGATDLLARNHSAAHREPTGLWVDSIGSVASLLHGAAAGGLPDPESQTDVRKVFT